MLALSSCDSKQEPEDKVLRVGVIAPLTGPASSWGEATVLCARIIADYYNETGGFEVDGQKVLIELLIHDDASMSSRALEAAYEIVEEGVDYVIGPIGDESTSAVSSVLDGAGIFYVHYGLNYTQQNESSLGVLGMPSFEQSIRLFFDYIVEDDVAENVLVMAYESEGSIQQKIVAEYIARESRLDVLNLSLFDVSEDGFDSKLTPTVIEQRVARIVELDPDLVVLVGAPPAVFILLVDRLRDGGYAGAISVQNFQDETVLSQLGDYSDDVYFLGGEIERDRYSDLYNTIKGRYLDFAESWSIEAETRMYALELILECVRQAGAERFEDTTNLYSVLDGMSLQDPFFSTPAVVLESRWTDDEYGFSRQLRLPIRISKMQDGQVVTVVGEGSKG